MARTRRHRRQLGWAWALALVVAACAAAPALGQATGADPAPWTTPVPISEVGYLAGSTQSLATNPEGDALAAWWDISKVVSHGSVWIARRRGGGAFTPPEEVSSIGFNPKVALDDAGDAVVVWDDGVGIEGTILPATGAAVPFKVSSGSEDCTTSYPAVGEDAQGDVTVFWEDCHNVYVSRRPAGGEFSAAQKMPDPGPGVASIQGTVAADGTATVAWSDYDGVHAASAAPGSTSFHTTSLTSDIDPSALEHDDEAPLPGMYRVTSDRRGDTAVAWIECRQGCGEYEVMESTRPAGGSFGLPQRVGRGGNVQGLGVSLGATGEATVAWVAFDYDKRDLNVWAATSTDRRFGDVLPARVNTPCRSAIAAWGVDVTTDSAGAIYVAWSEDGTDCSTMWQSERVAVRPPGAAAFAPDKLLSDRSNNAALPPSLAPAWPRGALAIYPWGVLAPEYDLTMQFAQTAGVAPPSPPSGGGEVAPAVPAPVSTVPAPPVQATPPVRLSAVAPRYRLRALRTGRRALTLTLALTPAGVRPTSIGVRATTTGGHGVVLARGRKVARHGGSIRVVAPLTRAGRALRGRRSHVTATLTVTVRTAGHPPVTRRRRVILS